MRVLTFSHWISYMALTASLMLRLLAVVATMKTSVLLSSIFFMADSVVSGNLMMAYLSCFASPVPDERAYFGLRSEVAVFGL